MICILHRHRLWIFGYSYRNKGRGFSRVESAPREGPRTDPIRRRRAAPLPFGGSDQGRIDPLMFGHTSGVYQAGTNIVRLQPRVALQDDLWCIAGRQHPEHVLYGQAAVPDSRLAAENVRVRGDATKESGLVGRLSHDTLLRSCYRGSGHQSPAAGVPDGGALGTRSSARRPRPRSPSSPPSSATASGAESASFLRRRLLADDFDQSIDNRGQLLLGGPPEPSADAFDRQRPDLADLDPRALGEPWRIERQREGEVCTGSRLVRAAAMTVPDCFVEDVVAEDNDRALAGLFVATSRVQVRPADIAPQYSGHDSPSSPSSARRCSRAGSSLAHSVASRVGASRPSFSARADSTA